MPKIPQASVIAMAKAQYWRGFQVSIDHHFGDLLLLARSGSAGSKSRIISCVFGNSQTNAIAPIIQNISIGRVSKMPTSPYEIPNTVCHEPLSAPLNAVGSMMPFPPNMDLTIEMPVEKFAERKNTQPTTTATNVSATPNTRHTRLGATSPRNFCHNPRHK